MINKKMNNKEKLTKLELIDSINMHYFKKGVLCENLHKISKSKLLEIYIDNKIDDNINKFIKIKLLKNITN